MDRIPEDLLKKDSPEKGVAESEPHKTGILKIIVIHQGVTCMVRPLLDCRHQVVGMIESAPRRESGRLTKLAKALYGFIDPKHRTLKSLAKSRGIPHFYMKNGGDEELAQWVRGLDPDLIAIHTMSRLLKPGIFSIPRFGAINLHQSCLPEYRGPNPDFWHYHDMMLNPGVSVHYIDDGEDSGDIIFQERMSIPPGTRLDDYQEKLVGELGVSLYMKALDAIADSSAPRIPQPPASPTARARHIRPDEHRNLIDWNHWEIERIWHVLRGTERWLNAIDPPDGFFYKGQRWVVDDYVRCDMSGHDASRVYRESGRYFAACRDGKIFLKRRFLPKRFLARFC